MTKMSRRRVTRLTLALAAAGALLLTGCTVNAGNEPAPADTEGEGGGEPAVETLTPGVLKIGSQQSYIPGEFFPEGEDQVTGFSVDFVDEIASRLGLETEWVQVDYSAIITGLQSSQFDMGSGGMSPNPERLEQVDMVGYFQSGATFILRKEDEGKYADAQSLCGQTIGMLEGSSTLEAAVAKENETCDTPINVQYYTSTPLGLQGLLSGRIEAYTPDVAQTQFIVKENPNDFVPIGDYTLVDYLINYTFTKENTELRDAVYEQLQAMMEDGTYDEILDEWGITAGGLDKPAFNGDLDATP
ncbi:transporter substrate-binding domain-containing protein [Microbacterium sp.]|uniref:transporter substrate-binding domain-containing protein n=1 Tax=Microbacterium sp. TaxID=51671 RepID=UPI002811A813|nr:transporter substrate-binding domain-containing protein [Microbacterium sp.]